MHVFADVERHGVPFSPNRLPTSLSRHSIKCPTLMLVHDNVGTDAFVGERHAGTGVLAKHGGGDSIGLPHSYA